MRATGEHMNVQEQIKKYITGQPEPKRSDMRELHRLTLQVSPECKLWFFDGKDSKNHTVSNPTIGYGFHTMKYANGKSREFFQIGVSGNKTGISVYILGLKDTKYLASRSSPESIGVAAFTSLFLPLNHHNGRLRYGRETRAIRGAQGEDMSSWFK